jgi:IMP dehydrogenase
VESIVPFRGTVVDIVNQLVGGLKSGMSYTNSRTIAELQSNTEFVQISAAGWKESGAHDVGEIK